MSILSYPERGKWGSAKWRGNCSGHIFRQLFEQLQPKVFVDPMVGSGTSVEVATEMGIEAFGLDLYQGFNAIEDSILQAVGKEADFVCSHPPYSGMIEYSGNVWGKEPHPCDLSHCQDDEDFHRKMQLVLLNQREATLPGGYYGTIIGDWRRNGIYTSYQAEMIARMPSDELAAVIIKAQHNCHSSTKSYGKLKFPFIQHEYVIIWQRKSAPLLVLLGKIAKQQYARLTGTWNNIVKSVLISLGGQAPLTNIYDAVAKAAPEKLASNSTWREKVRQTLNQNPSMFTSLERGVWAIA